MVSSLRLSMTIRGQSSMGEERLSTDLLVSLADCMETQHTTLTIAHEVVLPTT